MSNTQANTRTVATFDYGEVTGLPQFRGTEAPGFSEPCELTPRTEGDHFVVDYEIAAWLLVTLKHGDPLLLKGPPGCGKTTTLMHLLGRMNWGVCVFRGSQTRDIVDIEGNLGFDSSGATLFFDGPGSKAYAEGHFLLMEEFTDCDPALGKEIHALVDRTPLDIPSRKDFRIKPHDMFRMALTGNRLTDADDGNGLFPASHDQASSTRSRFNVVDVGWMDKDSELKLLTGKYPTLPSEELEMFVNFAHQTREACDGDGVAAGQSENTALTDPVTTRHLDRMARAMHTIGCNDTVLKMGYLNALSANDREIASMLWDAQFGG